MMTTPQFHVARTIRRINRHEIGTRYRRLARVALAVATKATNGLHGAARQVTLTAIYHAAFTALTSVPSSRVRTWGKARRVARTVLA